MAAFAVPPIGRIDGIRVAAVVLAAGAAAVFVFAVTARRAPIIFGPERGGDPPPSLFYMRVPKTASSSLVGLMRALARRNQFALTEVRASAAASEYYGAMAARIDERQRRAVARRLDGQGGRRPAALAGHVAFYHVGSYTAGGQPPALVSLVREPLSRFASAFHYGRCRTTALNVPMVADWAKDNATTTLDECVRTGSRECGPALMWLQVPYFCGQAPQCWQVGSEWALSEAKHKLASHFLLVGLTEQMQQFVQLMQIILPQYFAHADEYLQDDELMHANPSGDCKKEISPSTKAVITKWPAYQMEYELYKFASEIFADTYQRTVAMSAADTDNLLKLDFHTITAS